MKTIGCDVGIIGSGFGGSLLGCIVRRLGLDVVIVDRQRHPRFAIGESSTPIADAALARIASRYDLPDIAPLSCYGTARKRLPGVTLGVKRGFSYFHHVPQESFRSDPASHSREMLVTANASTDLADTHWYRPDVDQHFADCARDCGAVLLEGFDVRTVAVGRRGTIEGSDASGEVTRIDCRWVVDASGAGRVLARQLALPDATARLRTRSRALYGHFRDVQRWADVLDACGVDQRDYPFPVDQAAVHHLLREGWMWQLRFDNGIASLGFALACDGAGGPPPDAQAEWRSLCDTYPAIAMQLAHARRVEPQAAPAATGRLQYLVATAAGPGWACLPGSAGFIDPLHSSGIAHTLCAVECLARILEDGLDRAGLSEAMVRYGERVVAEIEQIDRLVSVCYATRSNFRRFELASMLYFAAATHQEHQRAVSGERLPEPFLGAGDPEFRALVDVSIAELTAGAPASWCDADTDRLAERLRRRLEPYNHVGLLAPGVNRMYRYTAAPQKAR